MRLIELINQHGYRVGVEIGVWRGATAERILGLCPSVELLHLVDPYRWDLCHFVVPADEPLPARMPKGWYHSVMGETGIAGQEDMDALFETTRARLSACFPTRIWWWRQPSQVAARYFRGLPAPPQVDFVYIDAIHLYDDVLADLEAWAPLIWPRGLMSGDDWGEEFPGVQRAVTDYALSVGLPVEHEGPFWWVLQP